MRLRGATTIKPKKRSNNMGAQVAIMLVEGKYRNVPNELEWS
jgi:hypothetical protein